MVVDHDSENLDKFRTFLVGKGHLSNFCTSMSEAKSLMIGVYPDVFISRLDVEDDDGDILPYVSKNFPNAIRIAYDDKEKESDLMRQVASGNAHRYLCLPWDATRIKNALSKDIYTRSRISLHRCWKFIVKNKIKPALPEIVKDIEVLIRDEEFSFDKLVRLIEKDPVITANILKVVNSAAFAKNGTIGDLYHAVTYLGVSRVRELVLFICAKEAVTLHRKFSEHAREVADHCYKCSRLAGLIAEEILPGREKSTTTAALLHDIGKFLFFTYAENNPYLQFKELKSFFDMASSEYEVEEFGVTHAQLGGALMLWWNLPMTIVETAANHNMPLDKLNGIVRVVAIADRCLLEAHPGNTIQTDLNLIADKFPVDNWRKIAQKLHQDGENPFD